MRTKCFAVLMVIMLLSGCMVTEKSEDESLKEYRKYFAKAAVKLQKSLEYEKKGKEYLGIGDYDRAIENFEKRRNLLVEAKDLFQQAYNVTNDDELEEYAYYNIQIAEYSILMEESRINGIKYLKKGDTTLANQSLRKFKNYLKNIEELYAKSNRLLKKLESEGKL